VLDSALLVFMDNLEMTNSAASHVAVKSNAVKKHFHENCSEDDLKMVNRVEGRLDSALKLHSHCPLVLTRNSDVGNGEANGSRVICQCIKLKIGEEAFPLELKCGMTILGVHASQVDSIVVKHVMDGITPSTFEVKPASGKFAVDLKIRYESKKVKMARQQFLVYHRAQSAGKHM
jgi:methyl coenzyme M reductase subunit D